MDLGKICCIDCTLKVDRTGCNQKRCKSCAVIFKRKARYGLMWNRAHPERVLEVKRNWYKLNIERLRREENLWSKTNPDKIAESNRKRKYGIVSMQFEEMKISQGNRCKLCREDFVDTPHVDHNHACCPGIKSCGKCIRGLLCSRCNTGLGRFKDDIGLLQKAIQYLKDYGDQGNGTQKEKSSHAHTY